MSLYSSQCVTFYSQVPKAKEVKLKQDVYKRQGIGRLSKMFDIKIVCTND